MGKSQQKVSAPVHKPMCITAPCSCHFTLCWTDSQVGGLSTPQPIAAASPPQKWGWSSHCTEMDRFPQTKGPLDGQALADPPATTKQ